MPNPIAPTHPENILKLVFDDFYELLDRVAANVGDTLWAGKATTAHEALIDIAAKYDKKLESDLEARLEADCGFTRAEAVDA